MTTTSDNEIVEVVIDNGKATVDGRPVRRSPRGTVEDAALVQCSALAVARKTRHVNVKFGDSLLRVFADGSWQRATDVPDPARRPAAGTESITLLTEDPPSFDYPPGEAEGPSKEADRFDARVSSAVGCVADTIIVADQTGADDVSVSTEPVASSEPPVAIAPSRNRPTVDEFLASSDRPRILPAQEGWRSWFHLPAGRAELERRGDIAKIKALPPGTWTIVVVNPKGGAGKTTGSRQIAATFAQNLVGPTLAWDNNPSRGNLGSRVQERPIRTVLDLIRDLDRLQSLDAQMSDLADYARLQPEGFYALASARRIAGRHAITAEQFAEVHAQAARFCRVIVVDTGNDETADSWQAAVGAADQLVIVTEAAQDSTEAAGEMMTDLRLSAGDRLVDEAISVVSERASAGGRTGRQFVSRMHVFLAEHTRTVIDAPFDQALDGGGQIRQVDLSRGSVRAWERVAAAAVEGFARQSASQSAMDHKAG